VRRSRSYVISFVTAPAPSAISTLSLHDALPICGRWHGDRGNGRARWGSGGRQRLRRGDRPAGRDRPGDRRGGTAGEGGLSRRDRDRKSTRLNSSHVKISYAVFCLKKKKITNRQP